MSPDTIKVDSIFEYGESLITEEERKELIGFGRAQSDFAEGKPMINPYRDKDEFRERGYDHFVTYHVPALVREQA